MRKRILAGAIIIGILSVILLPLLTSTTNADSEVTSAPTYETSTTVSTTATTTTTTATTTTTTTCATTTTSVEKVTFRVTAYCSCYKCCGKHALNRPKDENGNDIVYGASGEVLREGISCASPLPFGTTVELDGWGTVIVEDRTAGWVVDKHGTYIVDIYFANHETAWNFGTKYLEGVIL